MFPNRRPARCSVQILQTPAVPEDVARAGRMQSGNDTGQRGLAATGLPDQAHDLAFVHRQVDSVKGMHGFLAHGGT